MMKMVWGFFHLDQKASLGKCGFFGWSRNYNSWVREKEDSENLGSQILRPSHEVEEDD